MALSCSSDRPGRTAGWLALSTALALTPFLNKAVHIDDTLFLAAARQIAKTPTDFYGFTMNWYGELDPMRLVMLNPPLMSYLIAACAAIVGWSETALHAAFILPAIGVVLGSYLLARRCCSSPALAALIVLFSPVFMVSATTLMCDVTMLCFWVWSISLWDRGLRTRQHWPIALAALLVGLAALTKYFGASLIPLLLLYSVIQSKGFTWRLGWMLLPIAMLVGYHIWTESLYGSSLLLGASEYSGIYRAEMGLQSTLLPMITGLSFTGGCLIATLLFWPMLVQGRGIAALLLALIAVGSLLLAITPLNADGSVQWLHHVQLTAFVVTGCLVLVLAGYDLWIRRDSISILLLAWILGTFIFASILNWSITARTILPMAPAVAILIARRLEDDTERFVSIRRLSPIPLALSGGLAFLVTWADVVLANAARNAAREIIGEYHAGPGEIWFQGHWGFQHYMELSDAKPMVLSHLEVKPGDIIVLPKTNSNVYLLGGETPMNRHILESHVLSWITTMNSDLRAGFYSSAFGELPYAFGNVQPEAYQILEVAR